MPTKTKSEIFKSPLLGIFTYSYDQEGNRVTYTVNTDTTYYPNNLYNTDGVDTTKDIYAGDELVLTIENTPNSSTRHYVHTDHLLSSNVITDSSGNLEQLLDYYPFGSQRINSGSYSPQKQYVGQEYDVDTGLNYLQARYYDSIKGQFVSEDSQFWNFDNSWLLDPQNQNSYSYARNNPITLSDPSGKWSQGQIEGSNYLYENSSFWHTAMDNSYLPAIVGSYPLAVVATGGSASTAFVGLIGGGLAQYAGDVAGNLANGKTGAGLFNITSNPTQYAVSVASVGITSSFSKVGPLIIGGVSAGTSFVQDRFGGQPVTAGGVANNIFNGITASVTEKAIVQSNGVSGRLPSGNSVASFTGAHAVANYTKQAVSAVGQFVTSAVSSIANKLFKSSN